MTNYYISFIFIEGVKNHPTVLLPHTFIIFILCKCLIIKFQFRTSVTSRITAASFYLQWFTIVNGIFSISLRPHTMQYVLNAKFTLYTHLYPIKKREKISRIPAHQGVVILQVVENLSFLLVCSCRIKSKTHFHKENTLHFQLIHSILILKFQKVLNWTRRFNYEKQCLLVKRKNIH